MVIKIQIKKNGFNRRYLRISLWNHTDYDIYFQNKRIRITKGIWN